MTGGGAAMTGGGAAVTGGGSATGGGSGGGSASVLRLTLTPVTGTVSTPTFEVQGQLESDDPNTTVAWATSSSTSQPIVVGAGGAFSFTVDTPMLDSAVLTLTVTATSGSGSKVETAQVTVDRVAPNIMLTTPAPSSAVSALTLAGQVTDGSGSGVVLRVNGATTPLDGQNTFSYAASIPSSADNLAQLLSVEATDRFGNASMTSFSFTADVVAPPVQWTAPVANAVVTTATLDFDFTATDGSALTATCVGFGLTAQASLVSGNAWRCTLAVPLVDRSESLELVVRDEAGNQTTMTRSVVVDRVGPALSILTPAADTAFRAAFTVTASAGDAVSVTAQFEGATVPLTGGPNWSVMVPVGMHDFAPATLTLTATDANGNVSTATRALFVDTVAPALTFTEPTSNRVFNIRDFTNTNDIVVRWTVGDGDPLAATSMIQQQPAPGATSFTVATMAGQESSVSLTVTAADRAGNLTQVQLPVQWDRRSPTVTRWDPPSGSRMLDVASSTVIAFSEAMTQADLDASPLVVVGSTTGLGGTWNTAHDTFTVNATDFAGRVVELALFSGISDLAGNPVVAAVPNRKVHYASMGQWSGSTPIATGVSTFAVSSDTDGVVTIAYLAIDGRLNIVREVDGQLVATQTNAYGSSVQVNSWNTVDLVTLASTPQFGVSVRVSTLNTHLAYANGTLTTLAPTTPGVVVSRTPLYQEPTTALTGLVLGTSYTRGTHSVTLPTPAVTMAQSNDSWVVGSTSGTRVQWSKYRCDEQFRFSSTTPRTWLCAGTEYGYDVGVTMDRVDSMAMNRSGTCLLFSARRATDMESILWQQTFPRCDAGLNRPFPQGCDANTSFIHAPGGGYRNARVAAYGLDGVDGQLMAHPAYDNDPSHYRLHTVTNCDVFSAVFEPAVVAANVREFWPAQVGRLRGFFYVNTANELRVVLKR